MAKGTVVVQQPAVTSKNDHQQQFIGSAQPQDTRPPLQIVMDNLQHMRGDPGPWVFPRNDTNYPEPYLSDDEDQADPYDSDPENRFASLCDRFLQSSNLGNNELQERLQLSFLIQKYSDLVAKNSPFKIPKVTNEEQQRELVGFNENGAAKSASSQQLNGTMIPNEQSSGYLQKNSEEFNQREKEHLKNEISKVNALKMRLESLCKDLQVESKRIKEEGKKFFRSIEPLGTPIAAGLQLPSPISPDISALPASSDYYSCLSDGQSTVVDIEEFKSLNAKYSALLESYEHRERQFNSLSQLKTTQLHHATGRFVEQQELLNKEALKVETLKSQILNFVKTENELKRQLSVYVDKFKQVEETLGKSNELFMTFRKETEKMTKNLSKFEKENEYLKNKVGVLNRNILEMAEEKAKNQKTTETLANQKMKLEVLCRTLQAERNEALAQISKLKKEETDAGGAGSNAPPVPVPTADPNGEERASI